jgi:RNA polymerase sigma-70 factor (ECF subfamily)
MNVDSTMSATAESLLQQVATGNRGALNRLLDDYRPVLRRMVELRLDGRMRSRVDPSDVIQEAQMEASRRIHDFIARRPMPFHIWLQKTAYESLLRLRRRHVEADCRAADRETPLPEGSSVALAKQLFASGPSPSQQVRDEETSLRIRQAIAQLAEDDREILLLRNFDELSNVEAAQVLGIDPAAASKRYGRSLLRLRRILVNNGLAESHS